MRLYIDEDSMSRSFLGALQAQGHDVLTVTDAEMRGRPDAEQLAFAISQGRVIVTRNIVDFARLHAEYVSTSREHSGMVFIQGQHLLAGSYARAFQRLTVERTPEELTNTTVYLNNWL